MENLKTQIESVRNYAYKRLEKGDFNLIEAFFDKRLGGVRCLIEIDGYQISFVVFLENSWMFQSSHYITEDIMYRADVILFDRAIEIPEKIKEIAKNL